MAPQHTEYVGCRLTVLTKAGLRYEGTLFDLNQKNATVSLADVRIHGTEGRAAAEGKPEIHPSENTFKFLVFSGNDIKDLVVLNSPNDVVHADPAVIAINVPPKDFNASLTAYNPGFSGGLSMDTRRRNPPRSPQYKRDGGGGILNTMFSADELKKECAEEYDFAEANKNVDKQKIAEEFMNSNGGKELLQKGYNRDKGFYDDISNDLSWARSRQTATIKPVLFGAFGGN